MSRETKVCKFCHSELSSSRALQKHQQTAKYCLAIQKQARRRVNPDPTSTGTGTSGDEVMLCNYGKGLVEISAKCEVSRCE